MKIVGALICICTAVASIRFTANSDFRFSVLTVAVLVGGIACYYLYRLDGLSTRAILIVAVGLRLLLVSTPPSYSDDAYRYLWDGNLFVNGQNPFLNTPDQIAEDPNVQEFRFQKLNSSEYYSVYPPVSQYVFAAAVWLGDGDWQRSYLALKILIVMFELCGLFLIAALAGRRALSLYALNPIVIFEVAAQAHTESIAIPFLVAVVAATRFRKPIMAGVALGAATLVKLYPVIVLPALVRRIGWPVLIGFVGSLAVLASPFVSFDAVENAISSLALYVRLFEFNAGPYLLVKQILLSLTGVDYSKLLGPAFAFVGVAAIVGVHLRDSASRSIEVISVTLLGILIVTATTVHPWYLVPLLSVVALTETPRWHWQWLSIFSVGSYLLYQGGPYWQFVWIAWCGAGIIFAWRVRSKILDRILRRRARAKVRRVQSLLTLAFGTIHERDSVVDIGSGEGYVAEELHRLANVSVQLTDIRASNRTALPFVQTDATDLPFTDGSFDFSILYFVLHHCENPSEVLTESLRVSRRGVVIVESTYRSKLGFRLLSFLDRLSNRIRSAGEMKTQEEYLSFRTISEWKDLFTHLGLLVQAEEQWGSLAHRQVGFVVHARSNKV